MRTDLAQPIRLKDYRPPDWLVDQVWLDVSLHPARTKVRATLLLRPNPESTAAPVVLDGDGLSLVSLAIEGAALSADSYVATPDSLTIPQPDRKSTRLNSSHMSISYAVFCLKKKKTYKKRTR